MFGAKQASIKGRFLFWSLEKVRRRPARRLFQHVLSHADSLWHLAAVTMFGKETRRAFQPYRFPVRFSRAFPANAYLLVHASDARRVRIVAKLSALSCATRFILSIRRKSAFIWREGRSMSKSWKRGNERTVTGRRETCRRACCSPQAFSATKALNSTMRPSKGDNSRLSVNNDSFDPLHTTLLVLRLRRFTLKHRRTAILRCKNDMRRTRDCWQR